MPDPGRAPDPYGRPAQPDPSGHPSQSGYQGYPDPGHPIPAYTGPAHVDPGHLASFGGVLRPRRGQLLMNLLPLAGATLLITLLHAAGWGIVLTIAFVVMLGAAVVMWALSWWRVRFEVHGQGVHYYPPLGRMRRVEASNVAEVVHLNLRSPGSRVTEWVTVLVGPNGNRLFSVSTPMWAPAYLEPVLAPLLSAGVTRTMVDEPLRVSELRPRHADMLPWARRHTGALVAIVIAALMVLMVISFAVG